MQPLKIRTLGTVVSGSFLAAVTGPARAPRRRLLDRLTQHVHILEMNGRSYRLAQSRKKTGR